MSAFLCARRVLLAAGLLVGMAAAVHAAPVAHPVATFSGLDKITALVTNFDAYINETVQFGSLQITPRVCYTEPTDQQQRTSVFVEVDQVSLNGASKRIFTGWMFADSPALNAIDDAVYDFWLVDCKQSSSVPPPGAQAAPAVQPKPAAAAPASAPAAPSAAGKPAAIAPKPVAAAPAGGTRSPLFSPQPSAEISPDAD